MLHIFSFPLSLFSSRAKRGGFTLVEMMVSLAIFSVVAVIAVGALTKVISANKKAQSIMSSVTTLNFALESMSRDLMTGTSYTCSTGSPSQPDSINNTSNPCSINVATDVKYITFLSQETNNDGTCHFIHAYSFTGSPGAYQLQKAKKSNCSSITTSDFTDIISPSDMSLTDYRLGVLYYSTAKYPIVFIHLAGYAGVREKDKTYVDVETAVSSYYMQ